METLTDMVITLGLAVPVISEGILSVIRRWRGGIGDKFANIDNIVTLITKNQPAWTIPAELLEELTANRDRLQLLIPRCRSVEASTADRARRNSLLKATAKLCMVQVRIWAYSAYMEGIITADDVHGLGFLLPGENGGTRSRVKATDAIADVKVLVLNADFIRVVIDHASGENAAQTAHGWPPGVKMAMIVITAADGQTEVCRQIVTRLHSTIQMPEESHGKIFLIHASFLKHVGDRPLFGSLQTFSMPLTTQDLLAGRV
ncbi:MAG: hypothetical protein LBS12_05020 [Prevotellaceae bacterium]|jgi:hypothetical protein|nr:hypothetical protein [Prevotellaceae bacterium]